MVARITINSADAGSQPCDDRLQLRSSGRGSAASNTRRGGDPGSRTNRRNDCPEDRFGESSALTNRGASRQASPTNAARCLRPNRSPRRRSCVAPAIPTPASVSPPRRHWHRRYPQVQRQRRIYGAPTVAPTTPTARRTRGVLQRSASTSSPSGSDMLHRVVRCIVVRRLSRRHHRIDGQELTDCGVVVPGSEVQESGFGVRVLACESERVGDTSGAGRERSVRVVGVGRCRMAVGVGQQSRTAELIMVVVERRGAADLFDRQAAWPVHIGRTAVDEQKRCLRRRVVHERLDAPVDCLARTQPVAVVAIRRVGRPSGVCRESVGLVVAEARRTERRGCARAVALVVVGVGDDEVAGVRRSQPIGRVVVQVETRGELGHVVHGVVHVDIRTVAAQLRELRVSVRVSGAGRGVGAAAARDEVVGVTGARESGDRVEADVIERAGFVVGLAHSRSRRRWRSGTSAGSSWSRRRRRRSCCGRASR